MEYLKQILKTNKIDMNDLRELTDIFEMLGNQQETKNIFKKLSEYLSNIGTDYSVWEYDRNDEAKILWNKCTNIKQKDLLRHREIFLEIKKNKKPLTEYESIGFNIMLPILSREEAVGYFCLHGSTDLKDKWKDVYIVTLLLGFTLRYYEMIETMKEMSVIDVVTGLYNYRHFRIQIDLEVEKSKRFKKDLSLVVMKIKDFDEINKKLGFQGGEEVLKSFGATLQKKSRKTDMPSRLNDEMFAILLYETNYEGALKFVLRLKSHLEQIPVTIQDYTFKIEIEYNIQEHTKLLSSEEFLENAKKI